QPPLRRRLHPGAHQREDLPPVEEAEVAVAERGEGAGRERVSHHPQPAAEGGGGAGGRTRELHRRSPLVPSPALRDPRLPRLLPDPAGPALLPQTSILLCWNDL